MTSTPAPAPDLADCANEPIERPGTVQPHGVMLVVEEATLTVLASSTSLGVWLPGVAGEPGTPLEQVLGPGPVAEIRERLAEDDLVEPIRWADAPEGPWQGRPVDVMLHRSGRRLVVELEAPAGTSVGRAVSLSTTRSAIGRIERGGTPQEVLDLLARAVQRVTGFDRVMVYRFDREWNGAVVAEVRRPDLEPFLGLHYPATDIPAQARRLYTLNRLRFVVDSHAVASRLVPAVPGDGGGEVDMSFAPLRSVSPVHLEYLRGMGVKASMSVSMVRGGTLWGLVACHSYSAALQPSHDERAAADLLVQAAMPVITEREARLDAARLAAGRERLEEWLGALAAPGTSSPVAALMAGDLASLASLADATGVVVRSGGRTTRWGVTVDDDRAAAVVAALRRGDSRRDGIPAHTDHLDDLEPGLGTPEAAGALLLALGADDWVLWLGQAAERSIDWAGDPTDKTITVRADGSARIGPRRSFDLAREVLRGRSAEWDAWKVQAVAELGAAAMVVVRGREQEALAVAEDLHASLSPTDLPTAPGIELHVRYLGAAGGRFAGDWWDAFELPGRRLALVVGDVAGHGGRAAVVMSQLRTALRAYLLEGRPPGETLARLDGLATVLFPTRPATVVLAVVSLADGSVEISRAGHPHPLLASAGSAAALPVEPRPPVGIGVPSDAPVFTTTLTPGDVLVLHSDGVTERRELSHAQSVEVLTAGLAASAGLPLPGLTQRLLTTVPGAHDDDMTVLAMRWTGP